MHESLDVGELLAGLNTVFNASGAILLVTGFVAIRGGHIERHKKLMIAAFVCSVLFLISYLCRFALTGEHRYPGDGIDHTIYLVILTSHVLLAALVPWMAIRTLYLGVEMRREEHRKWARITWPIWIYVSVTGIIIYWMFYHYASV